MLPAERIMKILARFKLGKIFGFFSNKIEYKIAILVKIMNKMLVRPPMGEILSNIFGKFLTFPPVQNR